MRTYVCAHSFIHWCLQSVAQRFKKSFFSLFWSWHESYTSFTLQFHSVSFHSKHSIAEIDRMLNAQCSDVYVYVIYRTNSVVTKQSWHKGTIQNACKYAGGLIFSAMFVYMDEQFPGSGYSRPYPEFISKYHDGPSGARSPWSEIHVLWTEDRHAASEYSNGFPTV